MKEPGKKNKVIAFLDNIDDNMERRGRLYKNIWQLIKFGFVSVFVGFIQLGLVNLMYFMLKDWDSPLPEFLSAIFSEEIMGEGHSDWAYVLPFFVSNLIANTIGYFLNKSRTFKSDAAWWHYILYILLLFNLILFTTWLQGVVNNLFVIMGFEAIAPTAAFIACGIVQFLVLYPIQKFVLLKEKKVEPTDEEIKEELPR